MTDPPARLMPETADNPNAESPDNAAAGLDLALQDLIARAREQGVSDEVILAHLEDAAAALRKGQI